MPDLLPFSDRPERYGLIKSSFPKITTSAVIHTFVALVFFATAILQPFKNGPVIRSDGEGYHAWTKQLLVGPLQGCNYSAINAFRAGDEGKCINKYPMGTALARLPFFIPLSHKLEKGVVNVFEHRTVALVSALLGFLTYLLLTFLARSYNISTIFSQFLSVCFMIGSGAFHYATYDASFSHIYSAFGFAALLALLRTRHNHIGTTLLVAILTSWLFLVRNTNAFALVAIGILVLMWERRHLTFLTAMAVGGSASVLIQVWYNWTALNQFTLSSYEGESFDWSRPMAHYVLISFERGLLNYYPLLFFSILGSALSIRLGPESKVALATSLFYTVFYGFWHSWALGGGFGHRGFVDVMPLIAVSAFSFCSPLLEDSRKRFLISLLAFGSTVATFKLMLAYWDSRIPFEGTDRMEYIRALLW